MTAQAQRSAVLLGVIFLVAVVPSVLLAPALRDSYIAGCSATLLLAACWLWPSLAYLLWRRRGAGAVLLDLGPLPPEPVASVAGAALSIGFAVWALRTPYLHNVVLALGDVVFAAYLLLLLPVFPLGRTQLREKGILLPSQFIAWERIGAYTLHNAGTYTEITIRYRGWGIIGGFPAERALRCPLNRQEIAEAILADHIPLWSMRRLYRRQLGRRN